MKKLKSEEAITILEDMKVKISIPKAAVTQIKRNAALNMAIDALLRCSEIPNNSDLISRQDAIDALYHVDEYNMLSVKAIRNLPSAKPDRKTGRWIYGEDDVAMCDGYHCSECGFFVPWDYKRKSIDFIKDYNFCPSCGSPMQKEGEG